MPLRRLPARALPATVLALLHATGAAQQPADATDATRAAQRAVLATLPMADRRPLDDARRGLIESFGDQVVMRADGAQPAWSLRGYGFLGAEDAPDTVHPGLWRHARANLPAGLFKVVDRVYQVRGLDLSSMTLIEGDRGLIVVDPLTTQETAQAALAMYFRHRPQRPVLAVVYTHSHVDHFGGVRGVVNADDVAAGRVRVIAPAGFMEEAVSENVIAGPAMSRRAQYQFGMLLPRGPRGQVDAGLGKGVPAGTVTLIAPTQTIAQPTETHRIDGVDIVFDLVPGAEAPAEMTLYLPQLRVLDMAEIATQNFHNLLPMRGAQVRDALAWSRILDQALRRHGAGTDVLIAQHHWPTWGNDRVRTLLQHQRDAYRYVHDQTLRLMNHGWVGSEIAERLQLPASLAQDWSTHGFYGDLKHNVKAVYQRYLGHYDGNPSTLHALPPVETARRTVAYMGGADAVLQRAREDFARGDYRWVAQVSSQLVFADPGNQAARQLNADALEQLGYQVESATARNAFLQGARELRQGLPSAPVMGSAAPDVVRAIPLDLFFDALAVRLDGDKAAGRHIVLNWRLTDTAQQAVLSLDNSVLNHAIGEQHAGADATLTLTRATLDDLSLRRTSIGAALLAGQITIEGRLDRVAELFGLLDNVGAAFPLVEPRPAR